MIWDLAGNVWEWIDWDAGSAGFTTCPTDEITGWKEFSVNPTGSLALDGYKPNNDTYNSTNNGFGRWIGGTRGGALRGGRFNSNLYAGVFTLNLDTSPSGSSSLIGFRCVYRP